MACDACRSEHSGGGSVSCLTVMTVSGTPDHESHDRFPPLQGAFRLARRNRSMGAEHALRIPHLTPQPRPREGGGEIRESLTRLSQ